MRLGGPVVRRVVALIALVAMVLLAIASVASMSQAQVLAQVPGLPLPLPGDSEEPEPEPTSQPRPTAPEPTRGPEAPQVAPPEQTFPPMPMPGPMAPLPSAEPVVPSPELPVPRTEAVPQVRPAALGVSPVAAALPGAFGVSLAGLLAAVGIGQGVLALAKRGLLAARTDDGGIDVEATKRWRLLGGLGLLAAAAVVGVVGYLKISLETQVAVQIVYLASAGFAVLVLAVAGGALLVAEQLRADERRLREVEDALVNLAGQVQPLVSEPPRVIRRGKAQAFDPDVTTELR